MTTLNPDQPLLGTDPSGARWSALQPAFNSPLLLQMAAIAKDGRALGALRAQRLPALVVTFSQVRGALMRHKTRGQSGTSLSRGRAGCRNTSTTPGPKC
jgi:hypothetical protein